MSLVTMQEYKVLLTQRLLANPAGEQHPCWQATIMEFPYLSEEAGSREQVIEQLRSKIEELGRNAAIITLTAPVLPSEITGTDRELAAQGWDDYAMFENDSEALLLFDYIEEERDRQSIGDE
jgi:hypothetical protein